VDVDRPGPARKTAEKLAAQQAPPVTEPHADEQARAAEQPTRPQGDSKQQTDQPKNPGPPEPGQSGPGQPKPGQEGQE
jgi:NADH-quinone oxidoreductase subunit I